MLNTNNNAIIRNTNKNSIENIVRESLFTFLHPNDTKNANFVIKPNLGFKTDTKGGTTNITIIENVLKLLRNEYQPNNIILVESDGIAFKCEDVFEYLKLDKICSKYNVEFLNLSKEPTVTIHIKENKILKVFEIPKLFKEKNVRLINLAKLKTHEMTKFSGAIKNLFGLNPYIFKLEYHLAINDVLQDIYQIFKPELSIVDGIWAIDGYGPWNGIPVNLNTIIASNDALIADIISLKIIGWKVEDVAYLDNISKTENLKLSNYDVNMLSNEKFCFYPPTKVGSLKENIARKMIPFLKSGLPLFYYSNGFFKYVSYGEKGKYCKKIRSFP